MRIEYLTGIGKIVANCVAKWDKKRWKGMQWILQLWGNLCLVRIWFSKQGFGFLGQNCDKFPFTTGIGSESELESELFQSCHFLLNESLKPV